MPDKKLTDKEIVKALRSLLEEIRKSRQAYLEKVNEEHYPSMRYEYLLSDTIHEINRLQAENERLKTKLNIDLDNFASEYDSKIKAEAYKEFAERLKERKYLDDGWSHGEHPYVVEESDIDEVLEELVGDNNAENQNECM